MSSVPDRWSTVRYTRHLREEGVRYTRDRGLPRCSKPRSRVYLTPFIREQMTAHVQKHLHEGSPFYLAESEGSIVGWCDISFMRSIFAHSGTLGMGIISTHRGKGIGSDLLHKALAHAKAKGLARVELMVREPNKPAIALYEKFGFFHEGIKKKQ